MTAIPILPTVFGRRERDAHGCHYREFVERGRIQSAQARKSGCLRQEVHASPDEPAAFELETSSLADQQPGFVPALEPLIEVEHTPAPINRFE